MSAVKTNRYLLPVALGLTHGISDCISGYMIGSLTGKMAGSVLITLILVYNVLAFGGQTPFGILLDRLGGVKRAALISAGLVALGMLLFGFSPVAAIVLAGLGSAGFHVAGGAATLRADEGHAAGPGIFAAPGVMGLILGGYFAHIGLPVHWFLFGGMIAMILLLGNITFPPLRSPQTSEQHTFEFHDILMLVLLLAIAFRSAIWNVINVVHQGDHELLLAIGIAAMVGKVSGGFVADIVGWKNYAIGALGLAVPALALGGDQPVLLVAGIALLQSATPVAIAAMHRTMPGSPATAAGVALGLGIAVGGIPMYSGVPSASMSSAPVLLGAGLVAFLAYFFSVGKAAKNKL